MTPGSLRPGLAGVLAVWLAACERPSPAPDLSDLALRMSYDDVVAVTGGPCEHIHDRGVRVLQWHYADGSIIETGIHDGLLSGLNVIDSSGSSGQSIAAGRMRTAGVRNEMTEADLRARFGDDPLLLSDASDRECRWTWDDGTLTAILQRGKLTDAEWQGADGGEAEVLVSITDPVGMLLADLASEFEWDRARALQELEDVSDPRLADAYLSLLRTETNVRNRGIAALRLAAMDDPRASNLLLRDLERTPVSEDILHALGMIGDLRAEAALAKAEARATSPRNAGRIRAARRQIQERYNYTPPDGR